MFIRPCLGHFQVTPLWEAGAGHPSPAFCFSIVIEIRGSRRLLSCPALHRLVRPSTVASADFYRPIPLLHLSVQASTKAGRQTSQGNARDNLHPIHPPHILPHLPDGIGLLSLFALSPRCGCLVCGSCSSDQDFACGFLQIPSHLGHPCRSANGSHHQGP
jgi:hypothetical protein